ncbi:MAG TPA: LLM class oxidoreductase [Nitrososphaeraceae archaeon]|nr:LLM class oxidoreductase [Nitrososphaeraceae archaeon]
MSYFNKVYKLIFKPKHLTLGVVFAIEAYEGSIPRMERQVELAQRAEELNFSALWFRDVPLYDPSFGDIGQIYDPWTYLGYIAAKTKNIPLGTAAIIFTLRHPIDLAKGAASVDQLSNGRLILGIATGDRPIEYPAYGRDFSKRDILFRESVYDFRHLLYENFPKYDSVFGSLNGEVDLLPKPISKKIPLFVTGYSRQTIEWIAENSDGWLMYPRNIYLQQHIVNNWKAAVKKTGNDFKPFAQSLYIDLTKDPDTNPDRIHLGYRLGRNKLIKILNELKQIGVNHVFFNLKYSKRPANDILEELGKFVIPYFTILDKQE